MSLRGPRFCRQAQRDARARDAVEQKLIDLLNEPIRLVDLQRLRRRARDVVQLFEQLEGRRARALLARLNDRRDPLGRLFDCELSTSFRTTLRGILASKTVVERPSQRERRPPAPGPRPPEPTPSPEPGPSPEPEPEPEPEPIEIRDPPWPRPRGTGVVFDITDFVRDVARWARARQKRVHNRIIRALLQRAEKLAEDILGLLGIVAGLGALGFFAFHIGRRKFVSLVVGTLGRVALQQPGAGNRIRESGSLHHTDVKRISLFANSREFRELERMMGELLDVLDAIEQADEVERQLRERDSRIRVKPTVRGHAVEALHLQRLFQQGFRELPAGFPGIDGIRGTPRLEGGVEIYRNAEGVSIKSTQVTDPDDLLRRFEDEWLKPLVEKKYRSFSAGPRRMRPDVRVLSLRRKMLHLVFEEGAHRDIGPETLRTIARMKRRCRANGIEFDWFVLAGEQYPTSGDVFFRNVRRGE